MNLIELSQYLKVEVVYPEGVQGEDVTIEKVSPIDNAAAGSVTFVTNVKYASLLKDTKASAVIVRQAVEDCHIPQLIHQDPHFAVAKTANLFYKVDHGEPGISDQAFVHPKAELGKNVTVYPFAYVAEGAQVDDNVVLYPGVFVGARAKVGKDTVIHANSVIGERCIIGDRNLIHGGCVVGADGFGFAAGEGTIVKIPQTGIVRTEEDVEMGGCCTLDRAAMGETLIRRGTKFDSKVHIGHNAQIGEHCMFSAMTAVAGTGDVGNWVLAGGQSAIAGHFKVGNGVKIGAKSGVINPVEDGQTVMGFPAVPAMQWRRGKVHVKKLPEYEKRIKELEAKLAALEEKIK